MDTVIMPSDQDSSLEKTLTPETDHSSIKRKHCDETNKTNKKVKESSLFTEDEIPEHVFPIGDSVFIVVTTFQSQVIVHIRRYHKYGKTFYPTSEGITLFPHWVEYIMGRKHLPQKPKDLNGGVHLPEELIRISSTDYKTFTFSRLHKMASGVILTKSIDISAKQWSEMLNKYNDISAVVLDNVYRAMDFYEAYKLFSEGTLKNKLPNSLEVSLGVHFLKQVLVNTMCELLKDYGLKQPQLFAEELWANSIERFNSIAYSLEITELADKFYHNVWEDQVFLSLKPAMYINENFLKNVRLDNVLREARNVLCPPDTFECFDDV